MTVRPDASSRQASRLAMRLTPDQDALIRDAAAATGPSHPELAELLGESTPWDE